MRDWRNGAEADVVCGSERSVSLFVGRLLRLSREIGAFYAYRDVLLSHGLHMRGNVLHARNGVVRVRDDAPCGGTTIDKKTGRAMA